MRDTSVGATAEITEKNFMFQVQKLLYAGIIGGGGLDCVWYGEEP